MTDKEKLEKALVHLKKFIDGDCVCDSDILADFPELEDSKDEKIRKLIVSIVDAHSQGKYKEKMLSYLERQKEQRPSISTPIFRVGDYIRNKKTGDKVVIEQIDVKLKIYFYVSSDGVATVHSDFRWEDQNDWELIGQKIVHKPSEKQDYSGLTDFERAIHRGFLCAGVENVPVTIIKETAKDCLANLYDEQKPAWSEEDEKRYLSCLCRLETGNPDQPETQNSKWFMEHVSPHPHWKPSEEQMKHLEYYVSTGSISLKSLYNDLLKLK